MSTEPPKLNDCGIICYHDNKNVTYITLYAEYVPLTLKPTLYPRSYLRCLSSHLAAERPWHRLAMRHHEGFGTIGGDAAQMFLHYLAGEMIWNWFPSVLWSKRDNKLIILTHSLILCLTGLALTFFEGISQLMNNAQGFYSMFYQNLPVVFLEINICNILLRGNASLYYSLVWKYQTLLNYY